MSELTTGIILLNISFILILLVCIGLFESEVAIKILNCYFAMLLFLAVFFLAQEGINFIILGLK